MGIVDAMDWPPKATPANMNAFYLLILGQKPLTSKDFWSPTVPVIVHTLQWTWMIQGSDLIQGKVGRSRGDRYRTNMLMREELLKANYPWWCEKQESTVQGNTPSGLALSQQPLNPVEQLWWTTLTFLNRLDMDSGTVYGAASIQLTEMSETITA